MALDKREVPQRDPFQRLRTLVDFAFSWVDDHIRVEINRPLRAMRMEDNSIDRLIQRIRSAMDRCLFFDTTLEHGGPRPANQGRKYTRINDLISF